MVALQDLAHGLLEFVDALSIQGTKRERGDKKREGGHKERGGTQRERGTKRDWVG